MKKIVITKEDMQNFDASTNGADKKKWKRIGIVIDFIGALGISLLIIFSDYIANAIIFYLLLYALLVIIVLGAEFIGTYYGALEQYIINKKEKKEIAFLD